MDIEALHHGSTSSLQRTLWTPLRLELAGEPCSRILWKPVLLILRVLPEDFTKVPKKVRKRTKHVGPKIPGGTHKLGWTDFTHQAKTIRFVDRFSIVLSPNSLFCDFTFHFDPFWSILIGLIPWKLSLIPTRSLQKPPCYHVSVGNPPFLLGPIGTSKEFRGSRRWASWPGPGRWWHRRGDAFQRLGCREIWSNR